MKHRIGLAAVVFGLLVVGVGPATAQQGRIPPNYGVGFRPGLSPYLNLANTGSGPNGTLRLDPAINYYLGTVTEFDRRRNIYDTRNAFRAIEGQLASTPEDEDLLRPLPSTGHLTAFGNTAGYFGQGYPRLGNSGALTSRYTPPVSKKR